MENEHIITWDPAMHVVKGGKCWYCWFFFFLRQLLINNLHTTKFTHSLLFLLWMGSKMMFTCKLLGGHILIFRELMVWVTLPGHRVLQREFPVSRSTTACEATLSAQHSSPHNCLCLAQWVWNVIDVEGTRRDRFCLGDIKPRKWNLARMLPPNYPKR